MLSGFTSQIGQSIGQLGGLIGAKKSPQQSDENDPAWAPTTTNSDATATSFDTSSTTAPMTQPADYTTDSWNTTGQGQGQDNYGMPATTSTGMEGAQGGGGMPGELGDMAPQPGKLDHIPLVSQVKSLVQLARGDSIGAKQTQENFSRGAVGVAQVRGLIEKAKGDPDAAQQTQDYFWKNSKLRHIDSVPVVGHLKGGIHYVLGDKEKGVQIIQNASSTVGSVIPKAAGLLGRGGGGVAPDGQVDPTKVGEAGMGAEEYYNYDESAGNMEAGSRSVTTTEGYEDYGRRPPDSHNYYQ